MIVAGRAVAAGSTLAVSKPDAELAKCLAYRWAVVVADPEPINADPKPAKAKAKSKK